MSLSTLCLRLGISFFTLLILTRMMGRKEISQMTFFNFISAISIGTIGASLAIDSTVSIRNGLFALIGWAIFTLVLGWLNLKSETARKLVTGDPLIVIKDGEIMEDKLRHARLDINSLNTLLRKKNVFSIADVDYAIFETDGKLSVMKKQDKQPVTKKEAGITITKKKVFPIATGVISDGQAMTANLAKLHLNENWLENQLQMAGVDSPENVFYAEVQEDGTLYVDFKEEKLD
ncbi:DUF421 domain-containing protein [Paracerasibacillus soli]|uniref:DUF421 domain-containing protein n=1 Tax=Paracerasibacillus soli TaxID=480284 RepID=A0ABU5CV26_9BACI|nr:DUF421 domain-containing protein [Virgibacillus soli]MDY0410223.1 DUF421 domain-containing protein [Virgibacillus soli]